jgi:hypothetical protein
MKGLFNGCFNTKHIIFFFFKLRIMKINSYYTCLEIGLNQLTKIKRSGKLLCIIFKSRWITSPCPTQFFTTHKNLKWTSNMMINTLLWALCESNNFKNKRIKGLKTLITSCHMFFCNKKSFKSNSSRISYPSLSSITLASM